MSPGLILELVFHAETFAFDDDGLGVMQQPIQDSRSQSTVVIKDFGPFLEGTIGGDHDRPLFVAQRDDLEEEIGTRLVNGQVPQFVEDEQRGFGVFLDSLGIFIFCD